MYCLLIQFSSLNAKTSSISTGIFPPPGWIPTSLVSGPNHMEVDCLIDWSDDVSLCNEGRDPRTRIIWAVTPVSGRITARQVSIVAHVLRPEGVRWCEHMIGA
jgi:hypothetical protein